jgi:hypothetical protein
MSDPTLLRSSAAHGDASPHVSTIAAQAGRTGLVAAYAVSLFHHSGIARRERDRLDEWRWTRLVPSPS